MHKLDNEAAVVILSGGQDSTTCLYWAKEQYAHVRALTFDYGQRHKIEVEAARRIATLAGVDHEVLTLPDNILISTSPLTNKGEQVEKYESADVLPGGIEKTFVPGRNALFLLLAANRAIHYRARNLVIGVSQEDYGGYPDCRAEFIRHMEATLRSGNECDLNIQAPLMWFNKKQTVEFAGDLEGCMEALAWSHTCYEGVFPPCGKCHACLLRERGFAEAGVPDPLVSRAKAI